MHNISERESENRMLKEIINNWDEAYAFYLQHVCERVNPEFYKLVWKFIIFYREAFNTYGLDKHIIGEDASDDIKDFVTTINKKPSDKSLSEIVNAEYLPDIANELFVFYQFQYLKMGLTKELTKELTLNFASWLNKHELSSAKVLLN